jgi:hypothetical protein
VTPVLCVIPFVVFESEPLSDGPGIDTGDGADFLLASFGRSLGAIDISVLVESRTAALASGGSVETVENDQEMNAVAEAGRLAPTRNRIRVRPSTQTSISWPIHTVRTWASKLSSTYPA